MDQPILTNSDVENIALAVLRRMKELPHAVGDQFRHAGGTSLHFQYPLIPYYGGSPYALRWTWNAGSLTIQIVDQVDGHVVWEAQFREAD